MGSDILSLTRLKPKGRSKEAAVPHDLSFTTRTPILRGMFLDASHDHKQHGQQHVNRSAFIQDKIDDFSRTNQAEDHQNQQRQSNDGGNLQQAVRYGDQPPRQEQHNHRQKRGDADHRTRDRYTISGWKSWNSSPGIIRLIFNGKSHDRKGEKY